MTILTDLRCPKCGAPMDPLQVEKEPVCARCRAPVQVSLGTAAEPDGEALDAKVDSYRKKWVRLEQEYRQTRQAYREQKCLISGKPSQTPRSTPYLNEAQKKELEPYTAELIHKLVDVGERSNSLALRFDQALKSRASLEASRPGGGFPAWPAMFSNILEMEPHGPAYLDQFEPLMYELSRRDLLAPELGRVDTFWPIHMMVRSIPVMITRNLEFGWAMEINQRLMDAGALGRIACTELVEDLAMEMRLPKESH